MTKVIRPNDIRVTKILKPSEKQNPKRNWKPEKCQPGELFDTNIKKLCYANISNNFSDTKMNDDARQN